MVPTLKPVTCGVALLGAKHAMLVNELHVPLKTSMLDWSVPSPSVRIQWVVLVAVKVNHAEPRFPEPLQVVTGTGAPPGNRLPFTGAKAVCTLLAATSNTMACAQSELAADWAFVVSDRATKERREMWRMALAFSATKEACPGASGKKDRGYGAGSRERSPAQCTRNLLQPPPADLHAHVVAQPQPPFTIDPFHMAAVHQRALVYAYEAER